MPSAYVLSKHNEKVNFKIIFSGKKNLYITLACFLNIIPAATPGFGTTSAFGTATPSVGGGLFGGTSTSTTGGGLFGGGGTGTGFGGTSGGFCKLLSHYTSI